MRLIFLVFFLPSLAVAACPPGEDLSDKRAELHTNLLAAQSQSDAEDIANALWAIWLMAPDSHAQSLLDAGMERRMAWDLAESERLLDQLVSYCPDYAEGYNQRAFTRFMRNKYDAALADIDSTLARNPYHFGALSGKALTLMRQGRMELAQQALRDAVEVHPFLRERQMIVPDPEKDI